MFMIKNYLFTFVFKSVLIIECKINNVRLKISEMLIHWTKTLNTYIIIVTIYITLIIDMYYY